jgi:hypothetical protein
MLVFPPAADKSTKQTGGQVRQTHRRINPQNTSRRAAHPAKHKSTPAGAESKGKDRKKNTGDRRQKTGVFEYPILNIECRISKFKNLR